MREYTELGFESMDPLPEIKMDAEGIGNILSNMVREPADETIEDRQELADYLASLARTCERQQNDIVSLQNQIGQLRQQINDLSWRSNRV
jgi:chaperonin cofactor prefoldin